MTLHLNMPDLGPEAVNANGDNWPLNKETGFSPLNTFVLSVAGCSAGVYRNILNNSKIDHTFHDVAIDYDRSEEGAKPVTAITITMYVTVDEEHQGRAERATKMIHKYCPVVQSIDPNIQVTERVIFQ
ncbi:OsmC family protein [Aerococcaceae bacterium 50-4]